MTGNNVVPVKPPAGFSVRSPRLADVEQVRAMMAAHEMAEMGTTENVLTVDELRSAWTSPGFDLQQDAWVVETDAGRMAACIEVRELKGAEVESDGFVHPDFIGRGLGKFLLALAEARARSVTPTLPPGRQRALTGGIFATNVAAVRLFEELGFRAIRHFLREEIVFTTPPPSPEWPEEVTVHAFKDGDDIAAVYRVVQEAFKDHWGERRPTLKEWTHRWREGGLDPGLWFIAESGGAIAGVSLGKLRNDRGRVDLLGVLRPYRRSGLGLALLRQSFCEFYRRGITTVDLGVDAESLTGATRLYHRAGMREVSRFTIFRKEL
jgi:mycothiol synthase